MQPSLAALGVAAAVLAAWCMDVPRVVAAEAPTAARQDAPPAVRWLVFVDDLHLRFVRTGTIRTAVRRLVDEIGARGDAVVMQSDGPSGLEGNADLDRAHQLDAIKRITGNSLRDDDVVRSWLEPRPPGPGHEVLYRATVALTTLRDWLHVPVEPRRTSVLVIVSEGLAVAADRITDAPTLGPPLVGIGGERAAVRMLLEAVIASAQAARMPILAFDPREPGLLTDNTPPANGVADAELRTLTRRNLQELAASTGGTFVQGLSALPTAMTHARAAVVR